MCSMPEPGSHLDVSRETGLLSTPVAEEKKIENMPKQLPFGPHHCGTIFSKKMLFCKRTEKLGF